MQAIRKFLEKNKKAVILLVVVVGGFYIYTTYIAEPQEDDYLTSEDKEIVDSEIGREIVSTLNELKVLDIDPDFFNDPAFRSLTDFTVDVEKKSVGKQNPFSEENTSSNQVNGGENQEEPGADEANIAP